MPKFSKKSHLMRVVHSPMIKMTNCANQKDQGPKRSKVKRRSNECPKPRHSVGWKFDRWVASHLRTGAISIWKAFGCKMSLRRQAKTILGSTSVNEARHAKSQVNGWCSLSNSSSLVFILDRAFKVASQSSSQIRTKTKFRRTLKTLETSCP